MIFQSRYGTILSKDRTPEDIVKSILSGIEVMKGSVDVRSDMEVYGRTFGASVEMLFQSVDRSKDVDWKLFDDSVSTLLGAVDFLRMATDVLQTQAKKRKLEELSLIVRLVGNLLGGTKMSSQQMSSEVESVVGDLVAARKAFTAFNVTKELRNKGQSVFHREMRPLVHGLFRQNQMADYQQATVQPAGFPAPAILYFPPEIDPSDFTGDILTAKVVTPAAPVADGDDDDDDGDDDDDTSGDETVVRGLTADGILYVPRWMGRKMGVQAGNVRVEFDPIDSMIIVTNGSPIDSKYHPHVDTRKNIRFGKAFLISLGADWSSYKIEFKNDHVTISKG